MNTEDFSAFYAREIAPVQERFRKSRAETAAHARKTACICFLIFCAAAVFAESQSIRIRMDFWFIGGAVIALMLGVKDFFSRQLPRKDIFLDEVFPKLAHRAAPGMQCSPRSPVSREYYHNRLPFSGNTFQGSHCVSGCPLGVEQGFSRLQIEDMEVKEIAGRPCLFYRTIFSGVLYYADFNKDFSGAISILPDRVSPLLGNLCGNFWQKITWDGQGSLAVMDNAEFEKKFAVYAEDQIEARYVLTPDLMQQIVDLTHADFFDSLSVFFRNSMMIIAFEAKKSPFHYDGQDLTESFVHEMYDRIVFFSSIAGNMHLERRIWTKK